MNAEQIDSFVSWAATPLTTNDRPLNVYSTIFDEWGVPGVVAPADVHDDMASRSARSATIAVLRELARRTPSPSPDAAATTTAPATPSS